MDRIYKVCSSCKHMKGTSLSGEARYECEMDGIGPVDLILWVDVPVPDKCPKLFEQEILNQELRHTCSSQ